MSNQPNPDADSYLYPSEDTLRRIESWPLEDPLGWFDFIEAQWWMPDWGWTQFRSKEHGRHGCVRPYTGFNISTGGWSGNESIIAAMEKNFLWMALWWESRRGGHFKFHVDDSYVQSGKITE